MCRSRNLFSSFQLHRQRIILASGETVYAEEKGTVMLKSKFMNIKLINVLYVSCLHSNFLLISKFIEFVQAVNFSGNSANIVSKENKRMSFAVKENGIFFAKLKNVAAGEYVCGAVVTH